MSYKVIIVDDHKMFRNGLKVLIEVGKIGTVVAEADNGQQFLRLLEKHVPDIVLMDIDMPIMNGIEATKQAIKIQPEIKILVLSMFSDKKHYSEIIQAGAKGFIIKRSGKDELKDGIREVANGGSFFSNELLRNIIADYDLSPSPQKTENTEEINLTEREIEILKHLCQGSTTEEIAEKIFLSERTINNYRSKLLSKTNTKNTVALVLYAIKNKLVIL